MDLLGEYNLLKFVSYYCTIQQYVNTLNNTNIEAPL
jgi:hypothetical protein